MALPSNSTTLKKPNQPTKLPSKNPVKGLLSISKSSSRWTILCQRLSRRGNTSTISLPPMTYLSLGPVFIAIDFPRIVKIRKRRTRELPPIPKADKMGRTYEDFQAYLAQNNLSYQLEMDTFVGRVGGKLLLTFCHTFCNLIFARLLDNKTALKVAKHIQAIKSDFYEAEIDFFGSFHVILTDNGGVLGQTILKSMFVVNPSSFSATLIALTRRRVLRRIIPSFAIFCLREPLLIT